MHFVSAQMCDLVSFGREIEGCFSGVVSVVYYYELLRVCCETYLHEVFWYNSAFPIDHVRII